ncbi:MAG: ATP-binding protein [Thermodesulfobacteriota bacterium]
METALEDVPDVENETLKIFLFRAAQELLFNTVKHAGVESARLGLTCSDGWFAIRVSDAGEGFDPALMETASRQSGMGLVALRERTRSMGGRLWIESGPGQGSRLS